MPRVVARRGSDYLIETGRGDALGQTDVPLGRVYAAGKLGVEELPISSIAARGYWEDVGDEPPEVLADILARVEPLL